MGRLRQLGRVFVTGFAILLRGRVQFGWSFGLELLSTGVWIAVYLAFWRVIFGRMPHFQGWGFPSVVTFVGFQELYFGISRGLFGGAINFWQIIHNGRLDVYMVRPMDPRLASLCINLQPGQLLRSALMAGLCLGLALFLGFPFRLLHLVLAVLLAFTISYVAFWWENVDALYDVIGIFDGLLQVPMNILPLVLQVFFTLVIPLSVAVTFPTLFTAGQVSAGQLAGPLLWLLAGLGAWWWLQGLLWRLGVRKYESYGR